MTIRSFVLTIMMLLSLGVARADEVTVSAAISLKESLEAIRSNYQSSSRDRVKLTFGASGNLAAQIKNGAPVDAFISAARNEIDDLQKAGKTEDATIVPLAGNELVLIVPMSSKSNLKGFQDLPSLQRIAIGEPRTVPAGDYAKQTLEHLNLFDKLKGKLVYGLNVRQVLQYVQSGEVDAGIVYLSDAQQARKQVKVVARAEPDWHQPLEYWGVVISGSSHSTASKKFIDYLQTEPAQRIFHSRGFTSPTTHPTTAPGK